MKNRVKVLKADGTIVYKELDIDVSEIEDRVLGLENNINENNEYVDSLRHRVNELELNLKGGYDLIDYWYDEESEAFNYLINSSEKIDRYHFTPTWYTIEDVVVGEHLYTIERSEYEDDMPHTDGVFMSRMLVNGENNEQIDEVEFSGEDILRAGWYETSVLNVQYAGHDSQKNSIIFLLEKVAEGQFTMQVDEKEIEVLKYGDEQGVYFRYDDLANIKEGENDLVVKFKLDGEVVETQEVSVDYDGEEIFIDYYYDVNMPAHAWSSRVDVTFYGYTHVLANFTKDGETYELEKTTGSTSVRVDDLFGPGEYDVMLLLFTEIDGENYVGPQMKNLIKVWEEH